MAHVGEERTGGDQLVGEALALKHRAETGDALQHEAPLLGTEVREVAKAVECRLLGDGGRADRHAIGGLGDLCKQPAARGQRTDPVAGEAVDLGEAVEVDQRLVPVRAREQAVGRAVARQEVAIGLVEHQCQPGLPRQTMEALDGLRRVDGAGGVVRCHQHDGTGAGSDPRRGVCWVRHAAALRPEGEIDGRDAQHLQPHLVVEVGGRGQDRLVARPRESHERETEGLVAACRDRHVIARYPAPIGVRKSVRQRTTQVVTTDDRGVARHLRLPHRAREMGGEGVGRRVGRHRLGEIEQRLLRRKNPSSRQRRNLGDGRRDDGVESRVEAVGDADARGFAVPARYLRANRRIPRRAVRCCRPSGPRRPRACRRRRSARSPRSAADR